jgi:hypothetical protein
MQPQQPVSRKNDVGGWAAAIGSLIFIGAAVYFYGGTVMSSLGWVSSHKVEYRVSGTSPGGSLTYENESGGTEQRDVTFPWSMEMDKKQGDFVYVSVRNNYVEGAVTCQIWVDGKKYKESTSEGDGVIARCSGDAGK